VQPFCSGSGSRERVNDPRTELIVDREYTNILDKDACLVWMPELSVFDKELHDMVTDKDRTLIV